MTTPRTLSLCAASLLVGVGAGWWMRRPETNKESLSVQQQTASSQASWDMLHDTSGFRMEGTSTKWLVRRTYHPPQPGCTEPALATEEFESSKESQVKSVEVSTTNAQGKTASATLSTHKESVSVTARVRDWHLAVAPGLAGGADGVGFDIRDAELMIARDNILGPVGAGLGVALDDNERPEVKVMLTWRP